jgi:hypothetical protein
MIADYYGRARRAISAPTELIGLIILALLIGVYVLVRYAGLWGETDSSAASFAIRDMRDTATLIPGPGNTVYPNGYSFQAIAVFVMNVSGLSLAELQLYASALLMAWVMIPAWMAFRELTGSQRGATIASVLLFIQPEFLFVILRATHEKFTRGLMLLAIYLLVRSLRTRHRPAQFGAFVLVFYLAGYSIISLNGLLATSFISALGLALLLTWIGMRYSRAISLNAVPAIQRLGFSVIVLLILAFLFIFYAYPPARHNLDILRSVGDRVAALFLDVGDDETVNPYAKWVVRTWPNLYIYFAVSLANWLLLAASLGVWGSQTIRWLQRRWQPQGPNDLLLWAFFGAFGLQGALSIVVDVSGAIDGNLQHRFFPSFVMLAAPLFAKWLIDWRPKQPGVERLAHTGFVAAVGICAVLSLFKATNEPLLSNKWLFYVPAEMQALRWAEEKLPSRPVWTDYDDRMTTAIGLRNEGQPLNIIADLYSVNVGTRDFLISDVIRNRSVRIDGELPVEADSLVTYDNGQAQIYHSRPRTPYQP